MHDPLLWSIVGSTLVLMLWRPRDIGEVWWVTSGAALLILFRRLPLLGARHAILQGTDVYLFLTGMTLLSELAREHGVFDWFASHAIAGARGSSSRLFTLIFGVGIAVTALMSNDATAVVMTPAVLSAVKKAGVGENNAPLPYLFACAMIANAASFLLPISNPANLVVFAGASLPPAGRWLLNFFLPGMASIIVTYIVLRCWFRRELAEELGESGVHQPLVPAARVVLWGIGLMSTVLLTASALKQNLGAPACLTSLLVTLAVSWRSSREGESFWGGFREPLVSVSWSVLPLVAGLYCIVEAVNRVGVLSAATRVLQITEHWPQWKSTMAMGMSLGIIDNLFNNLSLGLIAGAAVQNAHIHGSLSRAVLLGIDLGPNLSVTGSLATILWLMRIRREGLNVSGWAFLRIGAMTMPLALAGALAVSLMTRQ